MRLARIVLGVLALAGPYACGAGAAIAAPKPIEPPSLEARVEKGELPSIVQRLPDTPSVVDFRVPGGSPGQYGGELSMLMSRVKDVRMIDRIGHRIHVHVANDHLRAFLGELQRRRLAYPPTGTGYDRDLPRLESAR